MTLLLPKPTKAERTAHRAAIKAANRNPLEQWRTDKARCDRLFASMVRWRDGDRCRLCRAPYRPQCAHLISRRYLAVRWDLDNAWCLCAACHKRYTEDPLAWLALMEDTFGREAWRMRVQQARIPTRPDLSMVRLALAEQAREMGMPKVRIEEALR